MSTITAYPGTIIDAADWSNFTTTRLGANDGSRAAVGWLADQNGIVAGFDLSSIPAGATIDEVYIEYQLSTSVSGENVSAYAKASINAGLSYTSHTTVRSTTSTSDQTYSELVPSFTPTAAQIKDQDNFYVLIHAESETFIVTARVDYLRVRVEYTEVAGPTMLKTRDGIAKASIKTICGVAIASIKSVDSIT